MNDKDSRKSIINLSVGLVLGYSIGFLFVLLGQSTMFYYLGGLILLFSIILSIILMFGLIALYWDIKKENGSGIMGTLINKYDSKVTKIAATSKESSIDIEYDE